MRIVVRLGRRNGRCGIGHSPSQQLGHGFGDAWVPVRKHVVIVKQLSNPCRRATRRAVLVAQLSR